MRYTQLFVIKILAKEFSLFFFSFVHHSQMPVSVSVSITCKHLLIICEQMLAFGLFPSVMPSGGLCLAMPLHRDVPLTFSPS